MIIFTAGQNVGSHNSKKTYRLSDVQKKRIFSHQTNTEHIFPVLEKNKFLTPDKTPTEQSGALSHKGRLFIRMV